MYHIRVAVYTSLCSQLMRKVGVVELMFTSDGQFYLNNSVLLRPAKDVLLTVNFMNNKEAFTNLKRLQVRLITVS